MARVSVAGDFVALEKLHRLVVVPVLHQHGLRELQRLQSSETSEKVGSPHFRDLSQHSPVTEIPGPAGSFVALEKLRRLVVVPVLHQPCLRELQALRRSEISEKVGWSRFRAPSRFSPVTEIPGPAGSFVALEKLRRNQCDSYTRSRSF